MIVVDADCLKVGVYHDWPNEREARPLEGLREFDGFCGLRRDFTECPPRVYFRCVIKPAPQKLPETSMLVNDFQKCFCIGDERVEFCWMTQQAVPLGPRHHLRGPQAGHIVGVESTQGMTVGLPPLQYGEPREPRLL